ncbi:MAG: EamA family transporter RarD [Woeseiaceae bacterium]
MNIPSTAAADETDEDRTRNGLIAALIAYTTWGFMPIYFKIVSAVPAAEVLAHRIVWAVPFGALIVALRRQWPEVKRALGERRTFGFLALAAVFIAINWFGYILAVQSGNIFQASLGYYINPLMYVAIGVWFLHERLRTPQTLAVALAAIGVAVLTVSGGQFPVIALTLATSFTIYGVIRSQIAIGGMPGLFIETLVLFPLAGGYMGWLMVRGASAFGTHDPGMAGLLLLAGPLTAVPLLFFALAARRLRLSTIGILQFIAPTLQFLMGLAYGEQLTVPRAICFSLIWIAVVVFSVDAWRANRLKTTVAVQPSVQ